jgi:hypothetical protein
MEALNNTVKLVSWVKALVKAVITYVGFPTIYCDNEALVNYVRGNSEVKSVRHMEQKMYYCREKYMKSASQLKFLDGCSIPSNVLTKVVGKMKRSGAQSGRWKDEEERSTKWSRGDRSLTDDW